MSHTSWGVPPIGSTPPYHLDPSPGGAPVLSPDGHWRWAGDHWELRDDPPDDAQDDAQDDTQDDAQDAAESVVESESDPATDQDSAASLD